MIIILSLACLNNPFGTPSEVDSISIFDQQSTILLSDFSMQLFPKDECDNPCTFSVRTPSQTKRVDYFAEDYFLGESEDSENLFSFTYDFFLFGDRAIKAIAYDKDDAVLTSITKEIRIQEDTFITLLSDTTCETPCTFTADASDDIAFVKYYVDGWFIGATDDANSSFALSYDFQNIGHRELVLQGFYSNNTHAVEIKAEINVESSSALQYAEVPYFYQFSNALYPSSSCQNTSIAMLLKKYGWNGVPDTITAEWGKNYAQTPSGLAQIFNSVASESGISKRLTPVTNGTLAQFKAELDAGNPTIIHGYFTSYGHVMVVLGYDANGYFVNDPAGEWDETFQGGYPYGWNSTVGKAIYYNKTAFEKAVATWDGYSSAPLWFHKIR